MTGNVPNSPDVHAEAPVRRRWFHFFHDPRTGDLPLMWHVGQWDAQIYGALIGFGVPLVAWFVPDPDARLRIYLWFAAIMGPLYWCVEFGEIKAQIKHRGLLDADENTRQRQTAQCVYYGVIAAVGVWVVEAVAVGAGQVHGLLAWVVLVTWDHPSYDWCEWAIITHSLVNGYLLIATISPLMNNYMQATSSQSRYDQRL